MDQDWVLEIGDGVETLDSYECARLLHEGTVGCLGISSDGAPELRPVNYTVDGRSVVIRTGEGRSPAVRVH